MRNAAKARPQMAEYRKAAPMQKNGGKPSAQHYKPEGMSPFKAGFLAGLCVGLLAMALVLWFWAVPTVDGAVQEAQSAVETASGQSSEAVVYA